MDEPKAETGDRKPESLKNEQKPEAENRTRESLKESSSAALAGLPHRPPFIFVRELIACQPGVSAECRTLFSPNDPIFRGHFPGNPLVPGVILTEALAQTAGLAAASAYADEERPHFLLSAIRNMKFLRAVRPGEEISLRAEKLAGMADLVQFSVAATVHGVRVAEGQLVLSIAEKS